MLKTIRKHTVTKTTLNFTPCFWRQRSVMLHTFGKIGKWSKILNIWANLKKIFKNVGCSACFIYVWLKDAKKGWNRLWKSGECVPFRFYFFKVLWTCSQFNAVLCHWLLGGGGGWRIFNCIKFMRGKNITCNLKWNFHETAKITFAVNP
jgi:hypothetical protein